MQADIHLVRYLLEPNGASLKINEICKYTFTQIDECLRLFPEHYEAYYYKGKQLLKRKMFEIAI